MKPLHIGLLVVGAAIAGGVAVKMTQPSSFPPAPRTPPAVASQTPKPVPVPAPAADGPEAQTEAGAATETDSAPPPVYVPSTKPWANSRGTAARPQNVSKPAITKPARGPEIAQSSPSGGPPPYKAPEQPTSTPDPEPSTPPITDPQPQPAEPVNATPAPPEPRRVTLPSGTTIPVRILQTLASDKLRPGDTFQGSLADPLVVSDLVIAERGARVNGRVVESSQAGKFQGISRLELAISSFFSSDGQQVSVTTSPWVKQGESNRNGDIAKIGGGAALGAIIGAIAGGGKGAAIGAGAGAGAGTGAVVLTPAKPITLPTETVIRFRLASPVTITERI